VIYDADGKYGAVGGQDPLPGTPLSPGAGSVTLNSNVLQGSMAGAGNGGGISLRRLMVEAVAAAGEEDASSPRRPKSVSPDPGSSTGYRS